MLKRKEKSPIPRPIYKTWANSIDRGRWDAPCHKMANDSPNR